MTGSFRHSLRRRHDWMAAAGFIAFLAVLVQASALPGGVGVARAQTVLTVNAGGPYSGTAGIPVTFSGSQSFTQNPQFSWSFGDGATAIGPVVSHAYVAGGVFSVTLTVTDLVTGVSASSATTASISGTGACIPGVTVPLGTNCAGFPFTGACIPGVTVPLGTNCAGFPIAGACIPGVTVPLGTNCFGPGGVLGLSGLAGLPGLVGFPGLLGFSGLTGLTCVPGLSVACPPLGVASAAIGCTPGVPPCGPNQTCTPVAVNQVFCSNTGPAPATTSTTAATAATTVAPAVTVAAPAPPANFGNCSPYDSACAYCQLHPGASICPRPSR